MAGVTHRLFLKDRDLEDAKKSKYLFENTGRYKLDLEGFTNIVLFLLIAVTTIFQDTAYHNYFQLLFYVFVCLGGYYIIKNDRIRFTKYTICMVIFFIWNEISAGIMINKYYSVSDTMDLIMLATVFAVLLDNYVDTENKRFVMVLGMAVSGLLVTLSMLTSETFNLTGSERILVEGVNPNAMGITICFSVLCCLYIFTKCKYLERKILCIILVSILLVMGVLTASRKTLIGEALVVVIFFGMECYNKRKVDRWLLFLCIGTLLVMATYIAIVEIPAFDIVERRMEELFKPQDESKETYHETSVRYTMIDAAKMLFDDNYLFGAGMSSFLYWWGGYSHNNYWELLANYGIIGLCLFYFPIVYEGIKTLIKKDRNSTDSFKVAGIVLLMFLSVGYVMIYERIAVVYILLLLAVTDKEKIKDSKSKYIK